MVAYQYLTSTELAELAGLSYTTVSQMCRQKRLPAVRKGRTYLIPRHAARALIRKVKAEKRLREITERFYAEANQ